jgi:soluble lytic murein transglycosylase-like protein
VRPATRFRPPRILPALLAAGLVGPLAVAAPRPARAELVVFEDGRFLKVAAFEVEGGRMRLALAGGGVLEVPLGRIERVVDDEVVPAPAAAVEPPAADGDLAWEFAAGQTVPATPYGAQIYAAAQRHAVNPALVAALVRAESAFDSYAVSTKGARGLMQLMPATARRFGLADRQIFDPERNLEAGTRYLRWLLDRFAGDVVRALAAYNAGEGTVDRYGGVPPFRETRDYIRRVYADLGLAVAL